MADDVDDIDEEPGNTEPEVDEETRALNAKKKREIDRINAIGSPGNSRESSFDILGLPPTASKQEISKAYRDLARLVSQDKNPDNFATAQQAYQSLNRAKEIADIPVQESSYKPEPEPEPEPSPAKAESEAFPEDWDTPDEPTPPKEVSPPPHESIPPKEASHASPPQASQQYKSHTNLERARLMDRVSRKYGDNPELIEFINNNLRRDPFEIINHMRASAQEPEVNAESPLEEVLNAGVESYEGVSSAYTNPNTEQVTAQKSAHDKIETAMKTISKMAEIQGKSWEGVAQVRSDGGVTVTLHESGAGSVKDQKEPSLFQKFKSAVQELLGIDSRAKHTNGAEAKASITIDVPKEVVEEDASFHVPPPTTPR